MFMLRRQKKLTNFKNFAIIITEFKKGENKNDGIKKSRKRNVEKQLS